MIIEVHSGGSRRELVERFMRKSKLDAVSQLVDFHLLNCDRIENLEAENYALQDQVKGLQELLDELQKATTAQDEREATLEELVTLIEGAHVNDKTFAEAIFDAGFRRPAQTEQQLVGQVHAIGPFTGDYFEADAKLFKRLAPGTRLYAAPIAQTAPQPEQIGLVEALEAFMSADSEDKWAAAYDKAKAAIAKTNGCSALADVAAERRRQIEVEGWTQHPDDEAVDRFAVAMKAKLAASREKGRHGWQNATAPHLSALLYDHMYKADPLDVGSLAMMLHQNGQVIELPQEARGRKQTAPQPAELERDAKRWQKCKTMPKAWWLEAMADAGRKGGRSLDESIDAALSQQDDYTRIPDFTGKFFMADPELAIGHQLDAIAEAIGLLPCREPCEDDATFRGMLRAELVPKPVRAIPCRQYPGRGSVPACRSDCNCTTLPAGNAGKARDA